jgi:glycosyltransferase involved in cell wall biosynthesis
MKILQVISYGYLAGGAEKSVFLLQQKLQERGHEVKVIASSHGQDDPGQRFSDVEFPDIDRPASSLAGKAMRYLWYRPAYRTIKTVVSDFKPDVVHFHTMGQLSPSALFAIGGVPGILTVHGPEEYVTGILEWGLPKHLFKDDTITTANLTTLGKAYYLYFGYVQRPLYILGFRKHIRAMLAPSQYMANVLRQEGYGVPIHQVYNGIVLPKHRPLPSKRQLLYVGRLEHVKGVDVLLRAMPAVVKAVPGVHLHVVGDGASRARLEAFVAQQQLQSRVTFCGWLKGQAVNDKYRQSTAVVIPSVWPENLPTVCIEALATGRLVIGSRTGGIPELVQDGVTGRIVPPGDADALAAAIVDLLSQPNLAAASNACAASAQRFAIRSFIERLEDEYQMAVEDV